MKTETYITRLEAIVVVVIACSICSVLAYHLADSQSDIWEAKLRATAKADYDQGWTDAVKCLRPPGRTTVETNFAGHWWTREVDE